MPLQHLEKIISILGGAPKRFGVLAESSTTQLRVIARNNDVAVGDLFLIPSQRGSERVYVFRTTQYANIMNRTLEMGDVARNKLTLSDAYFSEDLSEETLLELTGMLLGYAEIQADETWAFRRPRRLPDHLADVYRVTGGDAKVPEVMRELLKAQLGDADQDLVLGDLLAGERALPGVPVTLPVAALSHHIGIFGRTGSGKSNLMMVMIRAVFEHNRLLRAGKRTGRPASFLAIDPHDEFRTWHANSGGADGVRGLVKGLDEAARDALVSPFYYLTAREVTEPFEMRAHLSRADLTPDDLISIMDFSEQQAAFCQSVYARFGEEWISSLLRGEVPSEEGGAEYLPGTVAAVQRRLGFLEAGRTSLVRRFLPGAFGYESLLPDLLCALEQGRVVVVDTTLFSEMEQFLFTTVVARVLFALRKALRSTPDVKGLPRAIQLSLGHDANPPGNRGQQSLADALLERLDAGRLPYVIDGNLRTVDDLPHVNLVVEEAPSILNPARLKFGSVFRDISRQGRKFRIGLSVISQQVTAIDAGILTQINTEMTMGLGNEDERRAAIRNASGDLTGFERELLLLGKGQILITTTFKEVPVPVQVAAYDEIVRA
ncbi:MAG: ATP-binding protein [Rubrivivax sp.]